MRRRLRPGTTSARMARSVSTSLGIMRRSAMACREGNSMYLRDSNKQSTFGDRASCCAPAGQSMTALIFDLVSNLQLSDQDDQELADTQSE